MYLCMVKQLQKSGKQPAQHFDRDAKPWSALLKVRNTTDIDCANSEVPTASDTDLRVIWDVLQY
jgi:hypothetical protein